MTLSVKLSDQLAAETLARREQVATSNFMSAVLAQDPTLWGPAATPEASIRLGWATNPIVWLPMARDIMDLRAELVAEGIHRVVLCGMGGSSLGPEVIAAAFSLPLTVIDATHPEEIQPHLDRDLSDTVVVVSSKSGGTVETDSQRRAFEAELRRQGVDVAKHMVVVTDPQSPLHHSAVESGYRVFEGDPSIGGRFSSMSPFGLVPAGLAGLDLVGFLQEASAGFDACSGPPETNPALTLGVAMAHGNPWINKLLLRADPLLPGLGDWVEQLVAESTGKEGTSILPVVGSSLASLPDGRTVGPQGSGSDIEISGTMAEQMVLWMYATSLACAEIEVNPFDQPNVESAKVAARELLESTSTAPRHEVALDGMSLFAVPPVPTLRELGDLPGLLGTLAGDTGYIALLVFGPRSQEKEWRACARNLECVTGRPVTLGFGPRYLHSTGQLHKGGATEGAFLQVILSTDRSVEIPGRDFDFWTLLRAQADGDARVLAATGQPVVSLTGTKIDVARLMEALRA